MKLLTGRVDCLEETVSNQTQVLRDLAEIVCSIKSQVKNNQMVQNDQQKQVATVENPFTITLESSLKKAKDATTHKRMINAKSNRTNVYKKKKKLINDGKKVKKLNSAKRNSVPLKSKNIVKVSTIPSFERKTALYPTTKSKNNIIKLEKKAILKPSLEKNVRPRTAPKRNYEKPRVPGRYGFVDLTPRVSK